MADIAAVVTTYFPPGDDGEARFIAAQAANESWQKNLVYRNGHVWLIVEDDGSADLELVEVAFTNWGGTIRDDYGDGHRLSMKRLQVEAHIRQGVGASMNRGFRRAFEQCDVVLYAQDDWALRGEMDLTPWVRLLENNPDVGMVRLGPPHPGLVGTIHMYPDGWALDLDPLDGGYVFATRPALIHRRLIDAFGWFDEGQSAFEVERLYNERHAQEWARCALDHTRTVPAIVYALPYPWEHVESVELADIEPGR